VRRTLSFAPEKHPHQPGFLSHFINGETGQRKQKKNILNSDVSPIDPVYSYAAHSPAGHIFDDKNN